MALRYLFLVLTLAMLVIAGCHSTTSRSASCPPAVVAPAPCCPGGPVPVAPVAVVPAPPIR